MHNDEKAAKWGKAKHFFIRRSKKTARQVLTYNSKNFHWLNRKLDLERTMNGLEKPFRKKSDPKNRKNSKHQSEIAACEQKTTTDKANFCSNTVFSLYFKIRAKKFHAAKPLAFSLLFLFRRDQNHYSNLTSKIMKMCEQTLKKKQPEKFRKRLEVKIWLFSLIRCITSILPIDRQCNQFTKKRLENWKHDKGRNQKIIFSKNPNKILYKKKTCSFPSITHRNQLVIYLARSIDHLVLAEKP